MSFESRRSALLADSAENRATDEKTAELDGITNLLFEKSERHSLIECLDDGLIRLVDTMGGHEAIVQAARVSYGKSTKQDDRSLIRYLLRNWHTTLMPVLKFRVRVLMDCWRQWIRHRMASVDGYST